MAVKITPPLRLMLDIEAWKDETQLMTAAERGALLALKMFFWRTGPLPDDEYRRLREAFHRQDPGWWVGQV